MKTNVIFNFFSILSIKYILCWDFKVKRPKKKEDTIYASIRPSEEPWTSIKNSMETKKAKMANSSNTNIPLEWQE